MDTIQSVATAKQTLYKLTSPSKVTYLVAHNGKDVAHVIEMGPEQECLTGLGNLEKCGDLKAAEKRASTFGWTPVEIDDMIEIDDMRR